MELNVRSSCIIKDKKSQNVLLTNMRAITSHEAFLLPGGRFNLLENSYEAIAREMQEELGVNLEYRLVSVEENIDEKTRFQMIEFVFFAEIEDFNMLRSLDDGWDKFKVVAIADIDEVDVRPKTVKALIKQITYDGVTHNVNYNLKANYRE